MRLEQLGNISMGIVLSRIEETGQEKCTEYPIFTMQEMSYELGQYSLKVERQAIKVQDKKFDVKLLAKVDGIIVGLTSYKTIVVDNKHKGKIVPSNFAYIELDRSKIEPYYFSWYFNEHPNIRRHLGIMTQGSALRTLTVQMLRELEIPIPSLELQQKIGRVYQIRKIREKLWFEKNALEEQIFNQVIISKLEEDK